MRRAVRIAFAGDVHFEGSLRYKLNSDPKGVLLPVAPLLHNADISIVNLETAITKRGKPQVKAFTFRAPATAFAALRAAGVTLATMANNHGMDFGLLGLQDTLRAAHAAKFPVVGIGQDAEQAYQPYIIAVARQRIAFFGATQVLDGALQGSWTATPSKPGIASAKDSALPRLLNAVKFARSSSDTVVVYLHWGKELIRCPTDAQKALARQLIAAGADVIVGSHAHVLLGRGFLGKSFVHYGLGNFAFYARRKLTMETGILTLTIDGRNVIDSVWSPARIRDGVPTPLAGAEASAASTAADHLQSCTDLSPHPLNSDALFRSKFKGTNH